MKETEEIYGACDKSRWFGGIFLLCAIFLIFSILNRIWNNSFFRDVQFCKSYDDIIQDKEGVKTDTDMNGTLFFNGQSVSYRPQNSTFYISQNTDTEYWEGRLQTKEGCTIYFLEDEMWKHKREAIASGYQFSILIVQGNEYKDAKLVISDLIL